MHTVFINTTNNKIGGRFDSLKNAKDLKKLMYAECPLDAWYDEEKGYVSVVKQITEFIDSYNDVSNDYNLVVYVDMVAFFDLAELNFFDADSVEKHFLSELCKKAISRVIASTILKKLNEDGRVPSEKTVLLLELPETKPASTGIDPVPRQIEAMRKLLHLLPDEQLMQKLASGDKETKIPLSELVEEKQKELKLDLCALYEEKMRIWADSVAMDGVPLQRASADLCDAIENAFATDCANDLAISEYNTNKRTQRLSLEVYTKHNFLLQCYIVDCINNGSAYDEADKPRRIPVLTEAEWEEVKETLYRKQRTYEAERQKIANLSVDFTKLRLAPPLYMPDREGFGLNESGNIKTEYVIQSTQASPKKKGKNGEEKDDSLAEKHEALSEQSGVVKNWLDKSAYKPYDSRGDDFTSSLKNATADEYCEGATQLANHHLNLFNKLNMHVKRAMVNYSSRSISNTPPILRKRSVNLGESVDDSAKNDYKYAKKNGKDLVREEEATETVIETAKRSYLSIMIEYLKFDVRRGIEMVNIKEQCDWFIERIRQIEASLKKLFWILVVLSVTLAAFYFPFILIQWDAIVKNIDTFVVALAALSIPYVLLFAFYFVARVKQKRKMQAAWEELLKKSDEACEANRRTIAAYDSLMTRYIPALRWLYEYVLDVDFHCDCCEIARAKLAHHRDKLFELIESLGNFLEDLDYSGGKFSPFNESSLDYNNAFCEGDLNCDFYSIIDRDMLDRLQKREGGLK